MDQNGMVAICQMQSVTHIFLTISFSLLKMPTSGLENARKRPKSFYFMLLLTQTIGITSSIDAVIAAVTHGVIGYLLIYVVLFVALGIPLLYMELIIGQFTGLNSVSVWKVRPFLSHFGYGILFWQFMIFLYNHVYVSFSLHYFLVSLETPIPYSSCSYLNNKHCSILDSNYTVNQDCIKTLFPLEYCKNLYTTYPEYQYWRYITLFPEAHDKYKNYIKVSWTVCLPSGIICILLYVSCFKRKQSMKWFLGSLSIYPILCFSVLLIGTMFQKGIVVKFYDALDLDFKVFLDTFVFAKCVKGVIYNLAVGTGLTVNLGASCPFRTPSYGNAAVAAVAGAAFTMLTVATTAMMSCPYAYRYGISPNDILAAPMTLTYERIPRMLREYDYNYIWAIMMFSCHAALGLRMNALIFYNLLEVFADKFLVVAKYPGIVTLCSAVLMFFFTMPFLGPLGPILLSSKYRTCAKLISVFFVLVECFVFILWYGLAKFCEDVHFMQGIQPRGFMKTAWILSTILLAYVFIKELCVLIPSMKLDHISASGFWLLVVVVIYLLIVLLAKLLVSVCKKKFREELALDGSAWKPRSEVLQRSRAMFSAQAMTKEYLYRQYHLQAGILARQHRANLSRAATFQP